jgi:hypothetical protein
MNADQYRAQAANLRLKARAEASLSVRTQLESLADCYLQLAEHSEKKNRREQTVAQS